VALGSLEACDARSVWIGGRRVTDEAFAARKITPPIGRRSVKAPVMTARHFRTASNRSETDVIGILPGKIITEHLHFDIEVVDGDKRPDLARDLVKIAVVERHGKNGNVATGFVKGFGLKRGAIASTVCHDHHNIAVVGADYDDMAIAANRLGEIEGGFVVVEGGKVLAEIALPVAGLMSLMTFEDVHEALVRLRAAARSLDVMLEEPFLQLAFLALPVIPMLKITDRGLVDVMKFEIIG
jgi:adenine deaminase